MTPPRSSLAQAKTEPAERSSVDKTVLLVGHPNVGKSLIFSAATGHHAHVANYPGTTVDILEAQHRSRNARVYDLPGTNGLFPDCEAEAVTRDVLLDHLTDHSLEVVQVCDAKDLQRGLCFWLHLAELGVPATLTVNMMDEAAEKGIRVDVSELAHRLRVPVFGTVATERETLQPFIDAETIPSKGQPGVHYAPAVERAIQKVTALLPTDLVGKRGISLMLLVPDPTFEAQAQEWLKDRYSQLQPIRDEAERTLGGPLIISAQQSRMDRAAELLRGVVTTVAKPKNGWRRLVNDLTMHPVLGYVGAAGILYGIYLFVGVFGAGTAVDFLENTLFAGYITPFFDRVIRILLPVAWEPFFIGAAGGELGTGPGLLIGDHGVISMALSYAFAIILPIVGFFFIAFSILEDSGYLPRLAILLNRLFRLIGLNGKAVLPMVLGLGCDTMATMTSRILPTKKERLITILLLALAVPCSAQLGVILGLLGGLSFVATVWWLGAVMGVIFIVGALANRVLPGERGDFIMEIPPLRRPRISNVLIKTVTRVEWYVKEAVPLFVLGTFCLWILDRLSLLKALEGVFAPIIERFLGLPGQATQAFLVGFLRRDYGAAGLYDIFQDKIAAGNVATLVEIQIIVAAVTITLFVPCIANLFVMIKEKGIKVALLMALFIFPFAFLVGGLLNLGLRALWL